MFGWIFKVFGSQKSADPAAFSQFLERRIAYVTRRTIEDYCRVKAGRSETKMFADPDFKRALEHCRWQTFAPVAQDMAALAEAWLRPGVPGHEVQLADALAELVGDILRRADAPPEERQVLRDAAESLPHLLTTLQHAPPLSADRRPLRAEQPLLATLPVHADQRKGETPAIRGALRFHMVSSQQEMERAFLPDDLGRTLTAAQVG